MSCPFGETGAGKMGEMPPSPPQELSASAAAPRPMVVKVARARAATAASIGSRWQWSPELRPTNRLSDRIESEIARGAIEAAAICGRVEPQPGGRVPPLRSDNGPIRRHVPELWLQALAIERDGLGRVQGLARRRPGAPVGGVSVQHGLPGKHRRRRRL